MEITEKVMAIVKELSGIEEIETNQFLQQSLGLDSFYMVTLLLEIEEAFQLELNESDMNPFELNTVQDVIDLVEKYCGVKNE